MKMNIPEPARKIIDRLNEHGYEAYVVGGCVRDMILKREPGDWDITTSARPEQVKALFTRTLDTGIQHGTVTIMVGKEGYEVTTFRSFFFLQLDNLIYMKHNEKYTVAGHATT